MEKNHKVILLIYIFFVFGTFLVPGPKIAADFPYSYPESVEGRRIELPQTWRNFGSDGLGYSVVDGLWSWPTDMLVTALSKLDIPFWAIADLVLVGPFIIFSVIGMTKLLRHFGNSSAGQLVGTLFFLSNSYILLLIDGGQLTLAVAYSLLPMAFYLFIARKVVKFTAVFILLSLFDIRFIFLLSILIALWICFHPKNFFNYLKQGIVSGIFLVGWHGYWIIPRIITGQSGLPEAYVQVSQLEFLNFTTLGHALTFLQPHWPKNIFGQITPLRYEFMFLPILAFSPIYLIVKKKPVFFWTFAAIVFIFLTKGSQPPLSGVYSWLFTHVPGFFLFRDSTKFFSLQAVAYSALIAYAVSHFSRIHRYFYLIIVVYLASTIFQFIYNDATGIFSNPRNQKEYRQLAQILSNDREYGQIVWMPRLPALGFTSPRHPGLDATILSQKRPFAIGRVGLYESQNFIREAEYVDELFRLTGIKYLVYAPPDIKRDSTKIDDIQYRDTLLSQLSKLPWLKRVSSSRIPLFQISNSAPLFWISPQATLVVGSDDIYGKQGDLSQNALIFGEEDLETLQKASRLSNIQIYLNRKTVVDLAAGLVSKDKFLFPANLLSRDPNTTGWWKRGTEEFLNWRNFLQQKYELDNQDFDYSGGWSVAEGSQKLELKSGSFQPGRILLVRAMSSARGGELTIVQKGKQIGKINTLYPAANRVIFKLTGNPKTPDRFFDYSQSDVLWHEVGTIDDFGDIAILASGDLNVVNALITIPVEQWNQHKTSAKNIIERLGNSPSLSQPKVETEAISSTRHKVKITGISQPVILAFSQNYSPYWTANGLSAIRLYSIINGFPIASDGEYDIYYQPQKYVFPSLLISIATLSALLFLWVISKYNQSHDNTIDHNS